QVTGEDLNHVPLPTPPTRDWASAYLDAYTRFIVGRAAVAQSDGIQAFQLDWGAYWFDWTPYRDLFIAKMTAAAQQVRADFSGIQFTAADNENITVPQLKEKYLAFITGLGNVLGPTKRPVVWHIFAQ